MTDSNLPNDSHDGYARRRANRRSPAVGIAFSVILIVGGIAFFLDSLNVIRLQHLSHYWPLLLVALGVSKFFGPPNSTRYTYATLFVVEGIFFQLALLGIIPLHAGTIGPLLSIGCGVLLLMQYFQRGDVLTGDTRDATGGSVAAGNLIHQVAVFSGNKARVETQDFRGGDLFTVFGGIEIDLRKASVTLPGATVTIDNTTVFGSINLRVPETWVVVLHGLAVFGAYEDKTIPPRPPAGTEPPRLVLTGFTVFGAVTVEN